MKMAIIVVLIIVVLVSDSLHMGAILLEKNFISP
jgi:hypothetical protein